MRTLELTNNLLCFKEFIRSRGEDITYRGPQSIVHKKDAARMSFRVLPPQPANRTRATASLPERTRFLQCEEAHCGKCRRVDAETLKVFSNGAARGDL